jgi:phospholipase D-like protein
MYVFAIWAGMWGLIGVLFFIAWVIGLVDIFKHPMPRNQRAAWVIIVLLLPIVGTITYFALRKPTDREVQAQLADRGRRSR